MKSNITTPRSSSQAISVTKPIVGTFVLAAAFSLAINLLVLTSPLYMFQVFDRVLSSGHLDTLAWLTVLAGAAYLTYGLLESDRKSVVSGTSVSVRVDLGGRRIIKKKNKNNKVKKNNQ